jgi:plastocyanin
MHSANRFAALCTAALVSCVLTAQSARAEGTEFTIVIKDHRFTPAELTVPAGQKIRLVVENQDPTPEEFESYQLNREKIVPGNSRIVVFVGPLKPGKYEYFGEFNMATARAWLVAK